MAPDNYTCAVLAGLIRRLLVLVAFWMRLPNAMANPHIFVNDIGNNIHHIRTHGQSVLISNSHFVRNNNTTRLVSSMASQSCNSIDSRCAHSSHPSSHASHSCRRYSLRNTRDKKPHDHWNARRGITTPKTTTPANMFRSNEFARLQSLK